MTVRTRILVATVSVTALAVITTTFLSRPVADVTIIPAQNGQIVAVIGQPEVTVATIAGSLRQQNATTVTVDSDTDGPVTVTRTTTGQIATVTIDTSQLSEREHTLTVSVPKRDPHTFFVTVDRTPPPLDVTAPKRGVIAGDTLVLNGTTDPNVTITVGTYTTTSDLTGTFELAVADLTNDTVTLRATDRSGNTTGTNVTVTLIPSRVENRDVRALHVSFHAWADPVRRARIDALLDAGIVNAIQFDLKDESGHVGHRSAVTLANDSGAALDLYELSDVVAELHARNIAVIGRIVAFADPIMAPYAYRTGQPELAIQTPSGALYTGNYRGFTNFTHPTIINYTIDLAVEAAKAGVDHILWDYLRRPDGRLSGIVIPGLDGSVEDAIVAFTAQADAALHPYRIQHGASLYGISADRPREIGQDVARLRDHLDYVAPMIYPSHWGPGEYGVADPNRQPQAIVKATLNVWLNATNGSRARVIPWLEDTSYRAYDRPFHVREQHRGTYAVGLREWLMWDAASRFTPSAYDVKPPD
jgi:hypothetical protein